MLLGWSYATLWLPLLFFVFSEKRFDGFFKAVLEKENILKRFLGVLLTSIILIVIAIIVYEAREGNVDYSEWYEAIAEKCEDDDIKVNNSFLEGMFKDAGVISAAIGFFNAIFLLKKPSQELPKEISWWKRVIRGLI